MKRCPECRRDYYDETLLYCLDDGTPLLEGPASAGGGMEEKPTAIFHETDPASEAKTRAQVHATDPPSNGPGSHSKPFDKRLLLVPVALAVIILGAFLVYRYRTPADQIDSIAVLPFMNESGDPELEYLSDGMTETLISSLSSLPNLSVKARSSVFRFKRTEANPQKIGRELGVQALVNGRVLQRNGEIVLHVELVDAATENVLWKSDYSRPMANLVALQSEIARDVSGKLRARLSGEDERQVAKNYTENAEAYRLYLQGRFHWNKRKSEEHLRAIQYFEQAIALDPNYALAYAGIADCYAVSSSPLRGPERYQKLRAAGTKALELDPTLGEPHAALATLGNENWDWDLAEREYRKAIELNPNYATAHQWYGELLSRLGRHDEAIAEINRALELDPLSLVINSDKIYILSMARRYDEAIAQGKKTLEMDPTWAFGHGHLADAYLYKGLYEEAIAQREKWVENSGWPVEKKAAAMKETIAIREAFRQGGVDGFWRKLLELQLQADAAGEDISEDFIGEIYAKLGNRDEAFKWLSKAVDERESGVELLKVDPDFDSLRSDPRFDELLRRVRLL